MHGCVCGWTAEKEEFAHVCVPFIMTPWQNFTVNVCVCVHMSVWESQGGVSVNARIWGVDFLPELSQHINTSTPRFLLIIPRSQTSDVANFVILYLLFKCV